MPVSSVSVLCVVIASPVFAAGQLGRARNQLSVGSGGFPVALAVFFPLLVAALVGLAIWTYKQNQAKVQTMQAVAAERGWTFLGDANQYVDGWDCEPFHQGKGRRVTNCVAGTYRSVSFLAFEYHYYTESTSTDAQGNTRTNRTNHTFDVAVLTTRLNVPTLRLSPEGAFARFADAITNKDIDLESDAFNRAYRLRCEDRKFAFDTFHARTMEYLLAHPGTEFTLVGGDVVMSQRSRGFSPEIWGPQASGAGATEAPFDIPLTVLTGIPDFVWQDRGGKPAVVTGVSA